MIGVIACESSDTFFVPFGFANGQLVHYFSSVQENWTNNIYWTHKIFILIYLENVLSFCIIYM